MNTLKEKLAKLIENGKPCPDGNPFDEEACLKCRYKDDKHCDMTRLVDYLIQNGVTIATDTNVGDKWVSVDERLPEFVKVEKYGDLGNVAKSVRVLCSCLQKDGKQMVKEGYCQRWLDGSGAVWWRIPGTINKVTHWMPLPEPPKEVQ